VATKKRLLDLMRCHGLVPWRFTFQLEKTCIYFRKEISVTLHGAVASLIFNSVFPVAAIVNDHGTSPWHL